MKHKEENLVFDGPPHSLVLFFLSILNIGFIVILSNIFHMPVIYEYLLAIFSPLIGFCMLAPTEYEVEPSGNIYHKKFLFFKKKIAHKDDIEALDVVENNLILFFSNQEQFILKTDNDRVALKSIAKRVALYLDIPLSVKLSDVVMKAISDKPPELILPRGLREKKKTVVYSDFTEGDFLLIDKADEVEKVDVEYKEKKCKEKSLTSYEKTSVPSDKILEMKARERIIREIIPEGYVYKVIMKFKSDQNLSCLTGLSIFASPVFFLLFLIFLNDAKGLWEILINPAWIFLIICGASFYNVIKTFFIPKVISLKITGEDLIITTPDREILDIPVNDIEEIKVNRIVYSYNDNRTPIYKTYLGIEMEEGGLYKIEELDISTLNKLEKLIKSTLKELKDM